MVGGALVVILLAGLIIGGVFLLSRKSGRPLFGGPQSPEGMKEMLDTGKVENRAIPRRDFKGMTDLAWQPVSCMRVLTPLSQMRIAKDNAPELAEFQLALDFIHKKVMDHDGTILTVSPTATFAGWNIPAMTGSHQNKAAEAALALRTLSLQGGRIAIGMECGDAVVGNVGSERRFDYGAFLGPADDAQELSMLCFRYRVSTLLGPAMGAFLDDTYAVLEIDLDTPGDGYMFSLVGDRNMRESGIFQEHKRLHAELLTCFRERRFEEANEKAVACQGRTGRAVDEYYDVVRERCRALADAPPPVDWDGRILHGRG